MASFRNKLFSFFYLCLFLILSCGLLQSMRGGSANIVLSGQRGTQDALTQKTNKSYIELTIDTLKKLITWDWGKTIYKKPINKILWQAIKITGIVAIMASLFSLIVGITFGFLASIYEHLSSIIQKTSFMLLSFPVFIIAILLISVFSISLGLMPPGGIEHPLWFILPAIALGLKASARITLFFIDFRKIEEKKPYLELLKLYDISKVKYLLFNLFPNIALPIISLWLIEFSSFLAGAAITEVLFSLPGLGFLLLKSIKSYDINLLLSVIFTSAFSIFFISQLQQSLENFLSKKKAGLA